jgi:hypothetical protein
MKLKWEGAGRNEQRAAEDLFHFSEGMSSARPHGFLRAGRGDRQENSCMLGWLLQEERE